MTFANEDALAFFHRLAEDKPDPLACKFRAANDGSLYDAAYIQERLFPGCSLCDLGSGSGLIVNRLSGHEGKIVCVEPFGQFSAFIQKRSNLTVVQARVEDFASVEKFDVVCAFGLMQYFNEHEAAEIYKKIAGLLKPQGLLLVKNQFGLKERVTVSGFSREMNRNYYSEYRTLAEECHLLRTAGFGMTLCGEIYPESFNRWPDTRFLAISAALSPQCDLE